MFALYEISNSKHHLTAFSITDGKRLWDRELTHKSGFVVVALTVVGDTVGVTTWQNFTTYSAADGSERYRIGSAGHRHEGPARFQAAPGIGDDAD